MSVMSRIGLMLRRPVTLVVLAAVLVAAIAGTVVLVATPAGCSFGLRFKGAACAEPAAVLVSPSPQLASPSLLPGPGATPSQLPAPPSPLPSPTPNLPPYAYAASGAIPPDWTYAGSGSTPADLGLNCRLPIFVGQSGSGGFLAFPGPTYIADPRSAVSLPSPPAGYSPPPGYGQVGPYGLSYDKAYDRWLPVPRGSVSPDGTRYAYNYPGADGIYYASIATGAQSEIGEGHRWNVIDVEAQGVYATEIVSGQLAPGLWLVPFTGSPAQVTGLGYWSAVGGGAAYGTATSAVPNGVANTILRLDLKSGASQPWFTADSAQSNVIGFDSAGAPLIQTQVYNNGYYGGSASLIWVVPALGKGSIIISNANSLGGPPVADAHGIWFPGGNATYLFRPGQGTFVVASIGGNLAGGCA